MHTILGMMSDRTLRHLRLHQSILSDLAADFDRCAREYVGDKVQRHFTPDFNPDDGEDIFVIPQRSLDPQLVAAVNDVQSLGEVTSADLESGALRAVVGIKIGTSGAIENAVFKAIDRNRIIKRGILNLVCDAGTFTQIVNSALLIPEKTAMVFTAGNIYFENFRIASRMLDLSDVFEEATAPQVSAFLSHEKFKCGRQDQITAVMDSWCKKRIAMISAGNVLGAVTAANVVAHASQFDVEIKVVAEGGVEKIIFPEDRKGIKELLKVLNDDYLNSGLSGNKYETNSKVRKGSSATASAPSSQQEH